jgi:8-amino-7-oxononanoate synthase
MSAMAWRMATSARENSAVSRSVRARVSASSLGLLLPYLCGSEDAALAAAGALLAEGLLVTAIRPPTVAPGTSRLRVTVSAAHSPAQVDRLADALAARFP